MRAVIAAMSFALFLSGPAWAQLSDVGDFDHSPNTTYPQVRTINLNMGWKPCRVPGADGCLLRGCKAFPETLTCGGAGRAPCIYVWKRGNVYQMVWAYGEGVQTGVHGKHCKAVAKDRIGLWRCMSPTSPGAH